MGKRFRQFFCRHKNIQFNAATGACLALNGGNVDVGIVAICNCCGKQWVGDVRAACPEAYGRKSIHTPTPWPPK